MTRGRQADDGRVVLVNLTKAGSSALAHFRTQVGAVLDAYLAEISDEQVEALATATETLEHLVSLLQQRDLRSDR